MKNFLTYKDNRDVLFILGAGASHPDGVPLQRDILPAILAAESEDIRKSVIGKIVIEFINRNFHYSLSENNIPQLEALFGFIDYFISENESLNEQYQTSTIREIKEYLIKLIYHVVNLNTDRESIYYKSFWDIILKLNDNFSIITLNYDTLLEQTFYNYFQGKGYIDYCFHLMNYEKDIRLKDFNFWVNPQLPVEIPEGKNPIPIKIIKLHGSLNWKYCNCCNQTLLTPWDRTIDLNRGKFLGYTYPDMEEYEYHCPLDGTDFQTVMLPPSYLKTLHHPVISILMDEASREIRKAKKIVFIGYSLSNADIHIKALFKRSLNPNQKIYVINRKMNSELKSHYYSLSQNIKFLKVTFEDLVNDKSILEGIFKDI